VGLRGAAPAVTVMNDRADADNDTQLGINGIGATNLFSAQARYGESVTDPASIETS
jgi:hypothetical protein